MLKKIRVTFAVVSILLVTLLFVDFTGMAHVWLGWMAKIQFLPALLALNFGVVGVLVALTLLFGRLYCSVICPLGVMQDVFAFFGKKSKKNRYSYSPARNILRYVMLAVMLFAILAGISSVAVLLAPYSAYGRIAQTLMAPLVAWGNNLLALWAYAVGSEPGLCYYVQYGRIGTSLNGIMNLKWRGGRVVGYLCQSGFKQR